MRATCRATAIAVALALAGTVRATAGPFDGLHTIEGVSTSRNGKWISVSVSTDDYRARVPGYEETVTRAMGPDQAAMFLRVVCRAGPGTEHFQPRPAEAEIVIPDHPDQQPHNWWSPMFWILGLTGRAVEEVPVNVVLADGQDPDAVWHAEHATLERFRAEISAARTMLSVWIDGPAVLDVLSRGRAIRAGVRGRHTDVEGAFPAAPQIVGAARAMMRHCPKVQGTKQTHGVLPLAVR